MDDKMIAACEEYLAYKKRDKKNALIALGITGVLLTFVLLLLSA